MYYWNSIVSSDYPCRALFLVLAQTSNIRIELYAHNIRSKLLYPFIFFKILGISWSTLFAYSSAHDFLPADQFARSKNKANLWIISIILHSDILVDAKNKKKKKKRGRWDSNMERLPRDDFTELWGHTLASVGISAAGFCKWNGLGVDIYVRLQFWSTNRDR